MTRRLTMRWVPGYTTPDGPVCEYCLAYLEQQAAPLADAEVYTCRRCGEEFYACAEAGDG